MFEREITLNKFLLTYCDRLLADVTDEEFTQPMPGGGHSPQWIIGHLTIVADYAATMLKVPPAANKVMRQAFGPGRAEAIAEGDAFTLSALKSGLRPAYERLYPVAVDADTVQLDQPHGVDLLAGSGIDTRADLVAHILTTHFAVHLGQLSAWCRAHGRTPLF
jgi:hypothetical protein